jgi:hypothetical protein
MGSSAVVPFDCDGCAGGATFGETVVDGRLHWSLSHVCPAASVQSCGRDEPPPLWRDALLEQCGVYRLRIGDGSRIAVMKVLRERRGTPLRETPALVERCARGGTLAVGLETGAGVRTFDELSGSTARSWPTRRGP